ncbi:MAG: exo-alpha-sialidase [Chloroflexi bacterium]|nr:exo-alpha-sialidase [Chloroflexota bacterium]
MANLGKICDLLIYRNDQYYCGPGPSAVQLQDGTIIVAFRRAYNWIPAGAYAHYYPSTEGCLTTSTDGGLTWSPSRVFIAGNVMNQNLTLLPGETLLWITQGREMVPLAVYEKQRANRAFHQDPKFGWVSATTGSRAMRSKDYGATWEGPFPISPIPDTDPAFPGWPSPGYQRASATLLADGSIGIGIYAPTGPEDGWDVWLMVSPDQGTTWQARGRIAHDPLGQYYYNETGLYQCPSGKIVAFMRVEKDPEKSLYTSTSLDGGFTWSTPRREVVKGYPYQAARLHSGRVLLAYGYRFAPMGVRARLLDPECEDIAGAEEIVLRDDGGATDLGYPHVLPLSDGTALVTYYHNINGGTRHIAATLVQEA